MAIPIDYKEATTDGLEWKIATPSDDRDRGEWWTAYEDPLLDSLVRQVASSNQTVKGREAAYRQAVMLAYAAGSDSLPSLSLSPEISRSRSSGVTTTTRSMQTAISWDVDLWGKIRRQVESGRAAAQASEAELDAALLSAQAQLVSDYFQLRYQDSLNMLLVDTVTAYQRSLVIARNQYDAGIAARSDVVTAETQLEAAQAQRIAAGVNRAAFEHAIALLMGQTPAEVAVPVAPLTARVPPIPFVMPSALLERRPDIAQAERSVAAQSALIGVAVAAYYPTVSLSGVLEYVATSGGGLIAASNRVWSGAASGNQQLVDGGGRAANVRAARAAHTQSVANYRQVVLSAFQEVETCLSSLRILAEQAQAQARTVALARQGVDIALHEYEAGLQSYTAVVIAQATQLSSEQSQLQVALNRLLQSVALLEALGGGWSAAAGQ